jgi:Dolichyl-phosphate-mannose-protein mannosyltransferase
MRTIHSLADRDPRSSAAPLTRAAVRPSLRSWIPLVLVFAASLLTVRLVQTAANAPGAAFGGFSDEPAHYVAGLLVHDYLPRLFHESPMHFVQDYHTRLPYIGLGVWPPLFYGVEGLWMLLFGIQRGSALMLVALGAAGMATLLYAALKPRYGPWMALGGPALFLMIPGVQWSACMVMADLMCSLLAWTAVLFFARYYDTQKTRDALLMGVFIGLSLLTKNSTLFVLLVPPIAVLGTWRWDLVRKPALWMGGVLAVAIYAPWLMISHSIMLIGHNPELLPGFWETQRHYVRTLWEQTYFLLPLSAVYAAYAAIRSRGKLDGLSVSMIALVPACSLGIFVGTVPVQPRLLMLACAAVVVLAVSLISEVLRRPAPAGGAAMALAVVIFGGINWLNFRFPPVNDLHATVELLRSRDGSHPGSVLVPSAREGPWIAEFAQAESPRPGRVLLRPTKMLGEEDWNGTSWKPYYSSVEEMKGFFKRTPVKYFILGRPGRRSYPHDDLLRAMAESDPSWWRLVYDSDAGSGKGYQVYENMRQTLASESMVYAEADRIVNKVLHKLR